MAEPKQERPKGLRLVATTVLTLMAKHPELCFGIFVIITSIISNYSSSVLETNVLHPPKQPKPFFPPGSSVLDYPWGDLIPVADLLIKRELLVVLYYAPWCDESMRARTEYSKAARFLQNKVPFVAINCWWPQGACKTNYKFLRFPEIFVYHTTIDGIRYSGPLLAEYIIRFVEELMYPLTFLYSEDMILNFVSKQDNSLIGFFEFNSSPQPPGFTQFYYAAIRLLEKNPLQPIRCGVITQQFLADELGLTDAEEIIMIRTFNESLLFPRTSNLTSSNIWKWALLHKEQPIVQWLNLPGQKSLELSTAIDKGPALLVFAPVNHVHSTNYYLNMNEANYILRESFSRKSLANFIQNYTESALERHLRSESPKQSCDTRSHDQVCVQEVTSQTFHSVVMQQEKDVVLLITAKWCGFCSSFSHMYLQLAKYFSSAKDLLFARIDADKNDLRWEFTLDSYPTVLFFPAYRKEDSVVFPSNVSKTLPNLIKFILSHATSEVKTDTVVDICSKTCVNHNRRKVIHVMTRLRARKRNIKRRLNLLLQRRAQGRVVTEGALRSLWVGYRTIQRKVWKASLLQKLLFSHTHERLSQSVLRRHFIDILKDRDLKLERVKHDEL